jgi:hypothetical protein
MAPIQWQNIAGQWIIMFCERREMFYLVERLLASEERLK